MKFSAVADIFQNDKALPEAEALYKRITQLRPESVLLVIEDSQALFAAGVAAALDESGIGKVTVISAKGIAPASLTGNKELAARVAWQTGIPAGLTQLLDSSNPQFDLAVVTAADAEALAYRAVACERLTRPDGWLAVGSGADAVTLLRRLHPAVRSVSIEGSWAWVRKGDTALLPSASVSAPVEQAKAAKPSGLVCPVCEKPVDAFLPFGATQRVNARCPHCGALERHRLFWCYAQAFTNLFDGAPKSLLHVAPEEILATRLQKLPGINYLSADLDSPRAMVKMDLTDIQYPEATWDVTLCSHVLEHIPDDRKAMAEMYRTLKPGGWLLVQVPTYGDTTYENWDIDTEAGRVEHFGQRDHVRKYGTDIVGRLQEAGFNVKLERPVTLFDAATVKKHALKDQFLYICEKP